MLIPQPTDPRSLFETLSCIEDGKGVRGLVRQIRFTNLNLEAIYGCIWGHAPRKVQRDRLHNNPKKPQAYFRSQLMSRQFQTGVIGNFFRAYEEKKRLFFIHVPKCAGTDLRSNLSRYFPLLEQKWEDPDRTSVDELFAELRRLVLETRFSDTLFLGGHIQLLPLVRGGIVRTGDQVITVVRDPIEMALSAVNFALTRIAAVLEDGPTHANQKTWAEMLGIKQEDIAATNFRDPLLMKRILRAKGMTHFNGICEFIGDGTVDTTIDALINHNVEVTNVKHYGAWLKERWGIETDKRSNQSTKYFTREMLDQEDLQYILEMTSNDRAIYELIAENLERAGTNSILGWDIRLRAATGAADSRQQSREGGERAAELAS